MHQQFLQAIIENPDDDTHRLAYADWLNEQNGGVDPPRAEFIRVQIELAKHGEYRCSKYNGGLPDKLYGVAVVVEGRERSCGCRWCELTERGIELLAAHQVTWRQHMPNGWANWVTDFRRGFVEYIRLSAQDWLAHADELVKAAPIREVELSSLPVRQNLGDNHPSAQLITAAQETPVAQTWNGVEYHVRYKAYFLGRETVTIEGEFASYDHRQCCEELLRANWPHITFVLPSEPETHTVHWTGSVLEVPAAESIALGEFVARTPDGRVRRTPHRDGAVGIAVRSSEDNLVRVHLLEPFPAD